MWCSSTRIRLHSLGVNSFKVSGGGVEDGKVDTQLFDHHQKQAVKQN